MKAKVIKVIMYEDWDSYGDAEMIYTSHGLELETFVEMEQGSKEYHDLKKALSTLNHDAMNNQFFYKLITWDEVVPEKNNIESLMYEAKVIEDAKKEKADKKKATKEKKSIASAKAKKEKAKEEELKTLKALAQKHKVKLS